MPLRLDTAASSRIASNASEPTFWKEVVEDHLGQEMVDELKRYRQDPNARKANKEPTPEESNLKQAHTYQSVLWGELNDLVFLYLSLCRQH